MQDHDTIPYGYCHCGCGQKTNIASKTRKKYGWIKGEPLRYLHNHHARGIRKTNRYDVVDLGYKTPCWVWRLHLNDNGYGKVRCGGRYMTAHGWYYEQEYGPVPDGLVLDHLCRNRACVNPDHLEPVTQLENMRRGKSTVLTIDDVELIRGMKGVKGAPTIAKQYGVSPSTIYSIWSGSSWNSK